MQPLPSGLKIVNDRWGSRANFHASNGLQDTTGDLNEGHNARKTHFDSLPINPREERHALLSQNSYRRPISHHRMRVIVCGQISSFASAALPVACSWEGNSAGQCLSWAA